MSSGHRLGGRHDIVCVCSARVDGPAAGVRFGAAVVIATVGPLAIAVLRLILPYDTTDDAAAAAAKVAAACRPSPRSTGETRVTLSRLARVRAFGWRRGQEDPGTAAPGLAMIDSRPKHSF